MRDGAGVGRRALLAGIGACVITPGAGPAAASDALRIGTEADNAPFSLLDPSGGWSGFNIDLGNAVCDRLRRPAAWVGMAFEALIPAVVARRVDAALSQITVTPARAARVMFTRPVTAAGGILVVPDLSSITDDPASMKGKTVGVQLGTTHEAYARAVLARTASLRFYANQSDAFDDLESGKIDATLCDMEMGHAWLEAHAGAFRFADGLITAPSFYGPGTAIALHLGDDRLRAQLDGAIDAVFRDGTFATINARYFSFSIEPGSFGDPL